ncbi:MAG: GDP-mannose 4,6-dehydratase, partial [Planctomycetota bacterium]
EKLTIYGDGSQTRCFCYVDDMIDAMVALMSYDGPDASEPVNVGSEDERSMSAVVDCLGEILGCKLPVEHLPLPHDDPTRRRPDCTRARQRLHWRPRVSLPDGLRKAVEYFREAEATG